MISGKSALISVFHVVISKAGNFEGLVQIWEDIKIKSGGYGYILIMDNIHDTCLNVLQWRCLFSSYHYWILTFVVALDHPISAAHAIVFMSPQAIY